MKKYLFAILTIFFLILSTISISFASWMLSDFNVEGGAINYVSKGAICYNNSTGAKYTDLDIALNESSAGDYIYVYVGEKIDQDEDLIIKKDVHLVLPFIGKASDASATGKNISDVPLYKIEKADDRTAYGNALGDANQDNVNKYRSILLNMCNGADIINYGYLHLGGATTDKGNNGFYCEINLSNNSSITCYSGSQFDCYGMVKENYLDYANPSMDDYSSIYDNSYDSERFVEIKSGAKLNTYLALYDVQSGGNVTSLMNVNQCPFNTFDLQGIQTYLKINSGSNVVTTALVVGPSSMAVMKDLQFLDNGENEECLFHLYNGYISIENFNKNDVRYSNRNTAGAKSNFVICGDTSIGYLYIKEGVGNMGVELDTRKLFLPLSVRTSIFIDNESTLTTSQKLKFLLGSSLTVNNGSVFEINNKVIFYSKEKAIPYSATDKVFYNYSGESAKLINNGSIVLNTDTSGNGALGAFIDHNTSDGSALIDFKNISNASSLNVASEEGTTGKSVAITSQGNSFIDNDFAVSNFRPGGSYNSAYDGDEYYWVGDFLKSYTFTVKFNSKDILNPVGNYTLSIKNKETQEITSLATHSSEDNSFIIDNNCEFSFDIARTDDFVITNDSDASMPLSENTWYSINDNLTLTITPSEGYRVSVNYAQDPDATNTNGDWMSGTGHVTVTVLESENINGNYVEIGSFSLGKSPEILSCSTFVAKNSYFKIKWEIDSILYDQSTDRNALISTNPSTFNPQPTSSWNPHDDKESGSFLAGADYIFTMYWNYETVCISGDTLITMADGTYKKASEIKKGDSVLSFNHESGKIVQNYISANIHQDNNYGDLIALRLKFDDNTHLDIIGSHGLFDASLNEYVMIDSLNYDKYIGHNYYKIKNGKNIKVKLISASFVHLYDLAVTPVSYFDVNVLANDFLTFPSDMDGFYNQFDYEAKTLMYSKEEMEKDLYKYGILKYDELCNFGINIPEEVYNAFPFKYYKVAIGKGLSTWDKLKEIINSYLDEYLEQQGLM